MKRSNEAELAPLTVTRRRLLGGGAAVAAGGLLGTLVGNAAGQEPVLSTGTESSAHHPQAGTVQEEPKKDQKISPDRAAVLAAGMTEQEADCWQLAAETAGAFFALPDPHPMDAAEVSSAIHIIQNKLLSRPTYRAYLAAHKANKAKPNK